MIKRGIAALLLLVALAPPASGAWRTESSGTVFVLYYCAGVTRAAKVPAMVAWRFKDADAITQVVALTWLRVATVPSSPNCSGGNTEVVFRMLRTQADAFVALYLTSEGYDLGALSASEEADAFSTEFKADLLQWEAQYNAYLAQQAAPTPDPVDPLGDS